MNKIICNDILYYYSELGSHSPTIIFLHGLGGNHRHFNPQIELFSQQHRTISIDLRGHGLSGSGNDANRVENFSQDILKLVEALKIRELTLIGHSLGGFIALDIASQHLPCLKNIVMLDCPVFISHQASASIKNLFSASNGLGFHEQLRKFAEDYLFSTWDCPDRKRWILEDLTRVSPDLFYAISESMDTYDTESAVRNCRVPLLYIHGTTPSDFLQLPKMNPKAVTAQTVGSGHYHQLEVPNQINSIIQRFLEISSRK